MQMKTYVIHDSAVKAFAPYPTTLFARSHGEAERNFRQAVNEPKNGHLHSSPEQFTLFYVADYDDETGLFSSLPSPQAILTAVQAKGQAA